MRERPFLAFPLPFLVISLPVRCLTRCAVLNSTRPGANCVCATWGCHSCLAGDAAACNTPPVKGGCCTVHFLDLSLPFLDLSLSLSFTGLSSAFHCISIALALSLPFSAEIGAPLPTGVRWP